MHKILFKCPTCPAHGTSLKINFLQILYCTQHFLEKDNTNYFFYIILNSDFIKERHIIILVKALEPLSLYHYP